jgi:CBS domain-containing protein
VTISGINALGWTAIGIAAGFGSGFLTMLVYAAEDAFQKLPIHWMWWPIVGGVVIGIGGLIEPQALGVGYDNIRALLAGDMAGHAAFVLLAVKAVIWAVALGSGTSGGVLAPLLIMGGTLGVLSGPLLPSAPPGFWALLGMTAMMGGTMRSPLTSPLFAAELTGDYAALLPLLTASAASYAVTVLLLKRSILTEKIARRGLHVLREYHVDPFDMTRVRDVMVKAVDTLPVGMKISEAADFFTTEEPRHKTYPVVDGLGKAVGIVSRADVLRWLREKNEPFTVLAESTQGQAMCVCSPDDLVGALADRMIAEGHGHLPVVEPEGGTLVGFVARQDLLHARARMKAEESEHSRSLGWDCAKFRRRAARRG